MLADEEVVCLPGKAAYRCCMTPVTQQAPAEEWIEIYDQDARLLIRRRLAAGAAAFIPSVGDRIRVPLDGFPLIDESPAFEIVRREFLIEAASLTARVYGRDVNLGGTV